MMAPGRRGRIVRRSITIALAVALSLAMEIAGFHATPVADRPEIAYATLHAIVPLAFLRGPLWGGPAIVAGALFWTSLRVRIEGDGAHSRLCRYVLWGIPWRWHEAAEPIAAWTDGWGDFMDPEALHARVGEVELELGWSHRGSGRRADEIVAALTHPAPTPG